MAKFKLRGPDGGTYAITADTPEAAHAALYGGQTEAAPKVEQPVPQSPQEATDAMSTPDKFTRAGIKGLTSGASGIVNTLGKSIEGADPKKLTKLQQLIGAVEERMGVDKSQYVPASEVTGDSSKPLMERLANVPRSVVEMAGPAALGFAGGGLPGAVAATTASTAGPTVDRYREAHGMSPDQELSGTDKLKVGGKLALDAAALATGGAVTRGLMGPIEAAGVRGLTQAGKNAAIATGADAALGAGATSNDKLLIENQAPTLSDLTVGAAQGALPGLAAHSPGLAGRMPGAARDAAVTQRFKALETIDPQSRENVANLLNRYEGNFGSVNERLNKDLSVASKGLDDNTKLLLADAKIKVKNGQRLAPEDIQTVASASPDAGRVMQNMDTLGVMKGLDNGGLANSSLGRALNPFARATREDTPTDKAASWFGKIADSGLAYHTMFGHVSPEVAAMIAGGQALGTGLLHGVDRFTGASNPAKVITDKYSTGTTPSSPLTEAKAAVKIKKTAGETTIDTTPPEKHEVTYEGATVTAPKIDVGKVSGWKLGVTNRLVKRHGITQKLADSLGDNEEAASAIRQLYADWTHNAQDREQANQMFERYVDKLKKSGKLTDEQLMNLKDAYETNRKDLELTWKK